MDRIKIKCKKIKYIHIAGTNGKGSVAAYLNKILIESKFRVGKMTSPFLEKINETITVNNKAISNKEFYIIIKEIMPIILQRQLICEVKRFEIMVLISIVHFIKKKCDFVILESGIGGLNDSTNFVNSLISVVTSINYDHCDLLGKSIKSIARHKYGIVKKDNIIIVPYDIPQKSMLEKMAASKNASISFVWPKKIMLDHSQTKFVFNKREYITHLLGEKQAMNAAIAIECSNHLNNLGYKISNSNIQCGLQKTIHPGRFEIISTDPKIIFDGAHNPESIKNFASLASKLYKKEEKIIIFSCVKTKNHSQNIRELKKIKNCKIIFTSGISDEFFDSKTLSETAQKLKIRSHSKESFEKAIKQVLKAKKKTIFIVGSFHTYATTKKMMKKYS